VDFIGVEKVNILGFLEKGRPLSINAFFNDKTLDYQTDNQAFVVFCTSQYQAQTTL
jgi:hypothetical protein